MRGGARQGAGRKPSTIPCKQMTIWVAVDTFRKAQAIRKAGVKLNRELEYEIQRLYHLLEIPPDLRD